MLRDMSAAAVPVYLEVGTKRVFAAALDWPGWVRASKNEEAALAALVEYVPRYAVVAKEAGLEPPSDPAFEVIERLPGSGSTDFGAPGKIPQADFEPLAMSEAGRLAALVAASWAVMDRVVAGASAVLRKGPRGGGRDRDAVAEHVIGAEVEYARKLGIRVHQPSAIRAAILEVLGQEWDGITADSRLWPPRYAARRIAWHVLDHAWEIEDKSD
jgi:hypothetical protein